MLVVDTLMQAYRMGLHEALMITMPQLIMLNHGASCNKERMDKRLEQDKAKGTSGSISTDLQHAAADAVFNKPVEQMDSTEYLAYLNSGLT